MITIDKALKIEITKRGKGKDKEFCADATILPGSPTIGLGKTKAEAKFDLLAKILWSKCSHRDTSMFDICMREMQKAYDKWLKE